MKSGSMCAHLRLLLIELLFPWNNNRTFVSLEQSLASFQDSMKNGNLASFQGSVSVKSELVSDKMNTN